MTGDGGTRTPAQVLALKEYSEEILCPGAEQFLHPVSLAFRSVVQEGYCSSQLTSSAGGPVAAAHGLRWTR
jgi:hypothetical protein